MSSRGQLESNILQKNVEEQFERLVRQLSDIEEMRDDLDDDEYEEMKSDSIQQLEEMKDLLQKTKQGDMSLVDDVNRMQLAIQAAISSAFKTPQVIDMFAKKQPGQLRTRLEMIERDMKVNKISPGAFQQQKVEILAAVKKLGGDLSAVESAYLSKHGSSSLSSFLQVSNDSNQQILNVASNQIKQANSWNSTLHTL